jgi:serine/threonine protein kinase
MSDLSRQSKPPSSHNLSALTVTSSNIFDTDGSVDAALSGSRIAMLARAESPSVQVESLVGKSVGEFYLLQEIGRGGMGVVYKAHQKSLDRLVALKMLLSDHLHDPVRKARFLGEARAAAALSHPNIVQVYQIGECPAGHFFVMELIDGKTLEDLVLQGKLAIPWAVQCLLAVAEAVHFAHTKDIIHRDLKPANIMMDAGQRPVVMDFGIAKFMHSSASLTREGVIMVTPAYMAPEQAGENLGVVGPASDVYSLGAILYTLLTGRPPFDGSTPLQTVLKVISAEMPVPVRKFQPRVPEALEQICTRCLAKKPEDRYPTAEALADALRGLSGAPPRKKEAPPEPAPPVVTLVTTKSSKELVLSRPRTVFGRASGCDVMLKSSDVSKQHCQILIKGGQVVIEDLGSVNGIEVNGKRVPQAELRDGDLLHIVRYAFQVRIKPAKT